MLAKNEIKMLLLGAGESGKVSTLLHLFLHSYPYPYPYPASQPLTSFSLNPLLPHCPLRLTLTLPPQSTVLKQMKLIHHGGYNESERDSYKEIIFSNTIQSMR